MDSSDHRFDAFLLKLAKALHAGGAPAHDIERIVGEVGERAGVRAQCFSLPTQVSVAITEHDGEQRVRQLRVTLPDYNMSRLIALEKLAATFAGPESSDAAAAELDAILAEPPPWRGVRLVATGALLSATVAGLFRGGVTEVVCGGVTGAAFILGYLALSRRARPTPVAPVLLCAMAALLAKALVPVFPSQSVFIVIVSGVVLLLPGFVTTIALGELATGNLLSGSGRLAGAFITTLMMGTGVAIGSQLGDALLPAAKVLPTVPLPEWAFWACVAGLGVSFIGILQAPLKAFHISAGACLLACLCSFTVGAHAGDIAAAFVAAFVVAATGRVYQRITGKPAALVQVPGLLALVPGSVGFRGLNALIEQNFIEGVKITSGMVLTATALAVGTLLANGLGRAAPASRT